MLEDVNAARKATLEKQRIFLALVALDQQQVLQMYPVFILNDSLGIPKGYDLVL
jgi:hypothetical protein